MARVLAARDRAVMSVELPPQRVTGGRQPQMQIVMGGQRLQQLDVGARQAGMSKQRQPCRQFTRSLVQACDGLLLADVWGIGVDALDERAPQLGLPVKVGVK